MRYHAFVTFLYKFSNCNKKGGAHSHQQYSTCFCCFVLGFFANNTFQRSFRSSL